jgi:hypothetical protein
MGQGEDIKLLGSLPTSAGDSRWNGLSRTAASYSKASRRIHRFIAPEHAPRQLVSL